MKKNKKHRIRSMPFSLRYDPLTEKIRDLLERIPKVGQTLSRLYMWKPMMFNFMLVGASGTVLSWILYELIFRPVFSGFQLLVIPGSFMAMVIVTILVFLWNFTWNKRWSLKIDAQLMGMSKGDLMRIQDKVRVLLSGKFDGNGERIQ